MKYIIGIDEGTTSARAVLFNVRTNKIEKISRGAFKQYFPNDGWVEHNAEEIWKIVKSALEEITAGINQEDIFGIGITNQRESIVAFSRKTGKALAPSICWQCRRTADYCKKLKASPLAKVIKEKTGLMPDSYFSASKIRWLLKNNDAVKAALKSGDLLVGTIESFLTYKLTGGKAHVTDMTNASRTQLFNLNSLDWDDELLTLFGVPRHILPKIVSNSEVVGTAKIGKLKVPIAGLIGDQQSSLFGQGCTEFGSIKNTYGTGSFMLINTGRKPAQSDQLLSTVAFNIGGKVCYALEGSVYNCGTIIDWATHEIGLFDSPHEMDKLASKLDSNGGVYMVPAFTGMGCPYWNMDANGIITGLTRATEKAHIARAIFEGIAYSVYDVLKVLTDECHTRAKVIRVDGGVTKNNFLMQFQSDLTGAQIDVCDSESTVLGAIFMAGLATGAFTGLDDIAKRIQVFKIYTPQSNRTDIRRNLDGWHAAVKQCLNK